MWRLFVVTFGILALVFYELSGGADYAPVETSVQRLGFGPHLSREKPEDAIVTAVSRTGDGLSEADLTQRVEATLASLPVARIAAAEPAPVAEAEKIETLTGQTDDALLPEDADDATIIAALQDAGAEMRESSTGAIALFARAQREADTQRLLRAEAEAEARAEAEAATRDGPRDIRLVQGDIVNMRGGPGTEYQKLAEVLGGTEVVVLNDPGDGWLELEVIETGQVGWMADWLVSAAFGATDFAREGANSANAN